MTSVRHWLVLTASMGPIVLLPKLCGLALESAAGLPELTEMTPMQVSWTMPVNVTQSSLCPALHEYLPPMMMLISAKSYSLHVWLPCLCPDDAPAWPLSTLGSVIEGEGPGAATCVRTLRRCANKLCRIQAASMGTCRCGVLVWKLDTSSTMPP